jgi:hypothetical protein
MLRKLSVCSYLEARMQEKLKIGDKRFGKVESRVLRKILGHKRNEAEGLRE